jgi:hypothetical protein
MPYHDPIVAPGAELKRVLQAAANVCDSIHRNTEPMREGDMAVVDSCISLEVALLKYGCYDNNPSDQSAYIREVERLKQTIRNLQVDNRLLSSRLEHIKIIVSDVPSEKP